MHNINDIMYNANGKRTAIIDNELSKLDLSKFEKLDLSKGYIHLNDYDDGDWNVMCRLAYADCSEFIDSVHAKYLYYVDWLEPSDMTVDISLRNNGIVLLSVSADKFIDSENINTAYVESHDLRGEKGEIVKDSLIEAAKAAGIELPEIKQISKSKCNTCKTEPEI